MYVKFKHADFFKGEAVLRQLPIVSAPDPLRLWLVGSYKKYHGVYNTCNKVLLYAFKLVPS